MRIAEKTSEFDFAMHSEPPLQFAAAAICLREAEAELLFSFHFDMAKNRYFRRCRADCNSECIVENDICENCLFPISLSKTKRTKNEPADSNTIYNVFI